MLAQPKHNGIPLPKAWPRCVRSAIVHAVSMANVAFTTVPTSLGFWVPWLPHALAQWWPFCWWVAVAVDHYSRRVIGTAVFPSQPSAIAVMRFLDRALKKARPKHLITDQGKQFIADEFRAWCRHRGIQQRFGAIGKYGSLAVVERFIRSMKSECTRAILIPFSRTTLDVSSTTAPGSTRTGRTLGSASELLMRSTSEDSLPPGGPGSSLGTVGHADLRARDHTRSFDVGRGPRWHSI
jgi:transposase InsO family protein